MASQGSLGVHLVASSDQFGQRDTLDLPGLDLLVVENAGAWTQTQIQIPLPSPVVTLGNFLYISKPQFPHL